MDTQFSIIFIFKIFELGQTLNFKSKFLLWIICFSFLIYGMLSYIYFLERVIMPDMSYQLFTILKNDGFAIQIHRFGAVMTQIFPLISSKMGLSLKAIATLYSLSFPMVYLLLFFIIIYYKNVEIALIYFLFHFLINTHSFYWAQCELIQGVSFTLVYVSFINEQTRYQMNKILFWIINLVFLTTIVFFYPLLIIVLAFSFVYLYLNNRLRYKLYIYSSIVYIALVVLKSIFFGNDYDTQAISNIGNLIKLFPNYIDIPSFHNFIHYLFFDYYGLIFCFVIVVVKLSLDKKWDKLISFTTFFFGLIFLINTCYKEGAEQFYLEGQYSILCIIVGFPLVYDVLYDWRPMLRNAFVVLIVVLFVYRIVSTSSEYSSRVSLYRTLISQNKNQKSVIPSRTLLTKTLKMTWGSSFEIWLLSTMEKGKTSSIIIKEKLDNMDWQMDKPDVYITEWELFEYKSLNPTYFILKDKGNYIIKTASIE